MQLPTQQVGAAAGDSAFLGLLTRLVLGPLNSEPFLWKEVCFFFSLSKPGLEQTISTRLLHGGVEEGFFFCIRLLPPKHQNTRWGHVLCSRE